MNMVMNNDGAGGLFQANTLKPPVTWDDDLRARQIMGHSTSSSRTHRLARRSPSTTMILEAYDLGTCGPTMRIRTAGRRTDAVKKSQPPEILFIERCVNS